MVSATIVNGANQWLLPILIPPIYLTFRSYKVYLGRIEDLNSAIRRRSPSCTIRRSRR